MNENTKGSISFNFGEEDDLNGLLENINSSYSANVSCSFENYEEMILDDAIKGENYTEKQLKRRGIPQDIKLLSQQFTTSLFNGYFDKVNKNAYKVDLPFENMDKIKPVHQPSLKKKATMESTTGFSNAGTKNATFFNNLNHANSHSVDKETNNLNLNYTKTASLNKHSGKEHDLENNFFINENEEDNHLIPAAVGYAKPSKVFSYLKVTKYKYFIDNTSIKNQNLPQKILPFVKNEKSEENKIKTSKLSKYIEIQMKNKSKLKEPELPYLHKTPEKVPKYISIKNFKEKSNLSNNQIIFSSNKFNTTFSNILSPQSKSNNNSRSGSLKSIQKINFFNSPIKSKYNLGKISRNHRDNILGFYF